MNANWIEKLLSKQFRQLLRTIHSVNEDDHLVKSQSIEQMSQLLELFILINVDIKLGQTMKNKFSLVNENLGLVLEELLAIFFHFLWHGCTKHHNLFGVRSLDENFLNVCSHFRVAQNLITLVNDEEFALLELNKLMFAQIIESSWSADDNMWSFIRIF